MSGPDWLAALFLFIQTDMHPFLLPALFAGFFTAWIILSPIPAILLSAADEQSCLMIAPGQRLVQKGEGLEAIRLTRIGSLIGLFILAGLLPLASPIIPTIHRILAPHLGWMLWCSVAFLALSERPRSAPTALSPWNQFIYTMTPVVSGLTVLVFSGLLGLILFYQSPIALNASFINFIPAIIGIFAVPGLIIHVFMPTQDGSAGTPRPTQEQKIPEGRMKRPFRAGLSEIRFYFEATACGALSGMITALIPALTGTMSGVLTQTLAGTRNARKQLVAQGVTRMLYYGSGLLLIFLPGTPRMRSSSAALLCSFYEPSSTQFQLMLAVIAFSAIMAWFLSAVLSKGLINLIARHGTRPPSVLALSGILVFVGITTSWPGLLVLLTGTGIGMLSVMFESRLVQGIGVVLIPLAYALTT